MWYGKLGDLIERVLGGAFVTVATLISCAFALAIPILLLAWVFGDTRWYIAAPNWPGYDPHRTHLVYATGHGFEASELECDREVERMRKAYSDKRPFYCERVSLPRHWFNRAVFEIDRLNAKHAN